MVDEAVLGRLIKDVPATLGTTYGGKGKENLIKRLAGFNGAAHFSPWAVLIDLDSSGICAPAMLRVWLPDSAPNMCFRIAVRAIELWLLADRAGLATFLRVAQTRIPPNPDAATNPKQVLVQAAAASKSSAIRDEMVPRPGAGRSEGPAYASRLIEFAEEHWNPSVAAGASDSLRRCRAHLARVALLQVL